MFFAKYDHLKRKSEWKLMQRNFFSETFKPGNFSPLTQSRGNFLRILLLLSGNVERNPGPVSNYTLDNVNHFSVHQLDFAKIKKT